MHQSVVTTLLTLFLYLSGGSGGGNGAQTTAPASNAALPAPSQPAATSQGTAQVTSTGAKVTTGQPVSFSASSVNLRSLPNTGSAVVATVGKSSFGTLVSLQGGWAEVQLDDGRTGWVSDWMLDTKPNLANRGGASTSGGSSVIQGGAEVIGYYTVNYPGDHDSYDSLTAYGSSMTGIAPFLFEVDSSGHVTGTNNAAALTAAKARGLKSLALVHNLSGPWFNADVVRTLLSSPVNRARAVGNIASLVRTYGYSGVNIDFESVPASQRSALTAFVQELANALHPQGKLVTISVPAKTSDLLYDSWAGAYDYKALAQYADMIMVMAYDQHYRTGPAGPVASISWVRNVINYIKSVAPAQKFLLGVAGYGYDWSGTGNATAVSYNAATNLAKNYGKTVQWSAVDASPYFTYTKSGVKHTVWFESAQSIKYKLDEVKRAGMKGIALWRLGFEDPAMWAQVRQVLL